MTRRRPARAAGIVTLVAAALLGSAYALGRSLVPDRAAAAHRRHGERRRPAAGQPGGPAGDARAASPSPAEPARRPGRRSARDAGRGGPFGSLATTGTAAVALTFDDGPDPQYTPQVLALLREYEVKATFCVVGENAQSHPDLVQAIVAEGHTLCNHSWHHDVTLGSRSPDSDPRRSAAHQRGDPGRGARRADRVLPPAGRRLDVPGGVGGPSSSA